MRKLLTIILLAAVCICCVQPAAAETASSVASSGSSDGQAAAPREVTDCTLERSDDAMPNRLTDRNRSTVARLDKGAVVTVKSPEELGYIYIEWSKAPSAWQARCGDELVECNQNGFLHAVEEVSGSVLQLFFPEGGNVCDIYFYTPGDRALLPDRVQDWLPAYGNSGGGYDDSADILLVSTHADDEHLFFGGTMPYYAGELGLQVQVAYFTNHNNSAVRPHELLDGLWTVGITHYPIIGDFLDEYSDSLEHAKTLYDYDEALDAQVSLLRRTRSQVVLGHDLDGEYGHGVHMLNALTLTEAVLLAQDPESPYGAELDEWSISKLYLHLYGENEITMDWSVPLSAFGGKTAFEVACEGFECHASQQGAFVMGGKKAWNDCTKFGLYCSSVGVDTLGGDFMENIKPYSEQQREYLALLSSSESSEPLPPPPEEPEADFPMLPLILVTVLLLATAAVTVAFAKRR